MNTAVMAAKRKRLEMIKKTIPTLSLASKLPEEKTAINEPAKIGPVTLAKLNVEVCSAFALTRFS